jgi:hypothetical protein
MGGEVDRPLLDARAKWLQDQETPPGGLDRTLVGSVGGQAARPWVNYPLEPPAPKSIRDPRKSGPRVWCTPCFLKLVGRVLVAGQQHLLSPGRAIVDRFDGLLGVLDRCVGRSDRRQHGRGSPRPQINFTVPKAVIQAGRSDLMGDVCDCLIPSQSPKEAIEARRRKANLAVTEDHDHDHTIANSAKGEKPGERGAGPVKPAGYRPGRKTQKRRQGKKR